jgi:hypothetical protein
LEVICDDPAVEAEQQRELRRWATSLTDTAESERRAMGRAILMLLAQIESLRAELERRPAEARPEGGDVPGADAQATREQSPEDVPRTDPTNVGLRDRLLAAAQRRRR